MHVLHTELTSARTDGLVQSVHASRTELASACTGSLVPSLVYQNELCNPMIQDTPGLIKATYAYDLLDAIEVTIT